MELNINAVFRSEGTSVQFRTAEENLEGESFQMGVYSEIFLAFLISALLSLYTWIQSAKEIQVVQFG